MSKGRRRQQVRAAIREEEREEKREQVEPLRLATELIAAVKAGGGDNRILELLLQQNQAFLTALLNKPTGPAIAPGSDPLAALGLVTDLALKYKRKRLGRLFGSWKEEP